MTELRTRLSFGHGHALLGLVLEPADLTIVVITHGVGVYFIFSPTAYLCVRKSENGDLRLLR